MGFLSVYDVRERLNLVPDMRLAETASLFEVLPLFENEIRSSEPLARRPLQAPGLYVLGVPRLDRRLR
jgi:hypothetical protein